MPVLSIEKRYKKNKQGSQYTQNNIIIIGCRKCHSDNDGGYGIGRVSEHDYKRIIIAHGEQNQKYIGKNQDGVKSFEEVKWLCMFDIQNYIGKAGTDKNKE